MKRHKWVRLKGCRRCIRMSYHIDASGIGYLFSGDTSVCPHCGNLVVLPPASISSETDKSITNRLDKACHLIEVRDESRSTIGYTVYCKNGKHNYEWLNSQIDSQV